MRHRLDLASVTLSDIDSPARSHVSNDASSGLSRVEVTLPAKLVHARYTTSPPTAHPLLLSVFLLSLSISVPPLPFRPREQETQEQLGKMSDQEDLDYYIMFPSFPPSPKDPTAAGQDQREEFVFVYEEDKRPVVILLGWAGCQDRYLAKYSSIYEEKRYSELLISRETGTACDRADTRLIPSEDRKSSCWKCDSEVLQVLAHRMRIS